MEDKELSQWFDINVQKPWEPGVYEVELKGYTRDQDSAYSFWDGMKFSQPCIIGFKHVGESKTWAVTSAHRIYKWRGLASNLNAKPKPKGNRKVTRYVVMAQCRKTGRAECDGSFAFRKNAEARMESAKKIAGDTHNIWIQKIRFRTQEA